MKFSPKIIIMSAFLIFAAFAFFRVDFLQLKVLGINETYDIKDICKNSDFEYDGEKLVSTGFSKFTRIIGYIAAAVTVLCVIEALTEADDTKAGATVFYAACSQGIAYLLLIINAYKLKGDCKDAIEKLGGGIASELIKCNVLLAPHCILAGVLIIAVLTKKNVNRT
ncbi:MAG: hypothetical protein IKO47_03530 [Ruminococcus sp.]|nr:hypothetical protein [Ruminococcus sp.]